MWRALGSGHRPLRARSTNVLPHLLCSCFVQMSPREEQPAGSGPSPSHLTSLQLTLPCPGHQPLQAPPQILLAAPCLIIALLEDLLD